MASQMGAAFDAASGDARDHAAGAQVFAAAGKVAGLVGVQLVGPLAGPSARLGQWLDGVDDLGESLAVVNVGAGLVLRSPGPAR
jgi:hypothetical protein